jgi:hypothetical protein
VTLAGSKIDSFKLYYYEKSINPKNQRKIPCASCEKRLGYKAGKFTKAVVTSSQGK